MTERGKDLSALDPTRFTHSDIIRAPQVPLEARSCDLVRAIVGDEPFAIILPDELMVAHKGGVGCMAQMVEAYEQVGGNLISVLEIPRDEVSSYGVIDPGESSGALTEVRGWWKSRRWTRRLRTRSSPAGTSSSRRSCGSSKRRRRAQAGRSS